MRGVHELSVRPYNGRVFATFDRKTYERAHEAVFLEPDKLSLAQEGRFTGGCGKDGMWTYLIFADKPSALVHELSHVALHVFERVGIDPRDAGGEPFCYLLSQMVLDCTHIK